MQKLIYASVILFTLFVPLLNARRGSFDVGLKRSRIQMFAFIVVWAFGCVLAYRSFG